MSVAIKLDTGVTWGSSGAGTVSAGKILSCTKKNTAKAFEQMDENDELFSLIMHDQRVEVSLEVLATANATVPSPGDAVTVAGVTDLLVMDSEIAWKAGDTVKINMTLMKSIA